ncbi:MAG TPA: diguanylate cyclase [Geobacteraceae bacterium]|nr:diguanylate cyclase [Geobacteraceae bacterium]
MNAPQSERLLTYLRDNPLLENYCMSIYSSFSVATPGKVNRHLCGTRGIPHLCHKICLPSLNVAIEEALSVKKSKIFRCPLGLFSFAIPLSAGTCLVCSGVRENLFDLYFYGSEQFEFLKEKENIGAFELLEQLEKLPASTEKEVGDTVLKVERLIAAFHAGEVAPALDLNSHLQSTVMNVAAAIGREESTNKAIGLFSETLGILFDVPSIALVLKDEESNCWLAETCWGILSVPSCLTSKTLPFEENSCNPAMLARDAVAEVFPGVDADSALCLPLVDGNAAFGMAVLFDASLNDQSLSLAELLAGKLVEKLKENITDRETRRQKRVVRMLEMIRTLVLTESQDDLLRLILEMAAELVGASSGSIMIIDRKSAILRIASVLGINPILARSLFTRLGEGIAGRVAVSGTPLLIQDIEQEQQEKRRNRTRFGTKSCISLPLKFKGKVIGVLNLADKKNAAPFTPADQDILSTFSEQATTILGRITTLTKAKLNTITDSLTSLYNLRFIKKRLNEELSRSIRHKLHLSLMIVSLDNFAAYHDANGQADANRVVKKMARILNASLRDIDLVGRSNEAEFCIILPATSVNEAVFVGERIERSIKKELSNSPKLECMATSIGIASFPENGTSSGDLINAARAALSQAEAKADDKIRSSQANPTLAVTC